MNILDKLPPDKARHAVAGSLVAGVASALAMRVHPPFAWQAGMLAAVAAGLAKEVLDHRANAKAAAAGQAPPHEVSGMDALATALGGVPVSAAPFVAWLMTR